MALVVIPSRYAQRRGIRIQAAWLPTVEAICKRFSVVVSSGYRTAAENKASGGAPNSDHLRGDAADFVGSKADEAKLHTWAQGKFPYVEPTSLAKDHVHISFRHGGAGGETYTVGGKQIKVLRGAAAVKAVREISHAQHLDPVAVVAVATEEGADGKIGDHGTSYGPWQLHIHGALPARWARLGPNSAKTQAWAWSRPGFAYALGAMANSGVAGHTGHDACHAIVYRFEHPADPASETARAVRQYDFFKQHPNDMAPNMIGPQVSGGGIVIPPTPGEGPPPAVAAHGAGAAWSGLMHELGKTAPAQAAKVRAVAANLHKRVS